MKNSIYLILFLSLLVSLLLVQIVGIQDSFEDVWETIGIISPMILGAIFSFRFSSSQRTFFWKNTNFFCPTSFSRLGLLYEDHIFSEWQYAEEMPFYFSVPFPKK